MSTLMTLAELEAREEQVAASPKDRGKVEMIVSRPSQGERHVLQQADLDTVAGLVGDNWRARGSRHTEDGSAHPGMQIAIMNSRMIQLIAQDKALWSLAGDQLFIDLELSAENLPVGQRLAIGTAVLEVTDVPHNGCDKFTERFGSDATRFVNSKEGRAARRRGVNMRVVQGGTICVGDMVSKIETLS